MAHGIHLVMFLQENGNHLYHIGVRTREYYDLLDEKVELENEQKENKRQLKTYEAVKKSIQKNIRIILI